MEESNSPPNINPNANPPSSHCEECRENPWKYRCPGCSIRTCSLPCVKSHKQRTACTGQKDRSEIVPLSRFDDNLLLSDYNFLEDARRAADAARRGLNGIGGNYRFRLPKPLHWLRGAASRRRTRLLILPYGMTKRVNNRSRFDKRSNSIFWTIEWRFHLTNVVLVDHGVNERMNVCSVVEKHLKPSPWNHQLKSFCNEHVENLKFLLQKNPEGSKLLFRELNTRIPIGKQMADIVIVEYPIIYVYLPSHSYNFDVEKYAEPFSTNVKSTEKPENIPSPKGIVFREEEIEDNESSETQVLDLTRYMESEVPNDFRNPKKVKVSTLSDTRMSTAVFASSNLVSNNKKLDHEEQNISHANNKANASVGCGFDFEQDLKDAYSDLIGEINTDDYLCLDGLYSDEGEMEEGKEVCLGSGGGLQEEELEEGEIPSC